MSFTGGTISLHDERGVPLRGLGLGSTRLLIAGLQRQAAANASIILIDELEHGLEPHRIIMPLAALGAKDRPAPLQVFMTTHSPVAVRELSTDQLYILRRQDDRHPILSAADKSGIQGTVRRYPEALLAKTVFVCEGASEVGLMRGLDQLRIANAGVPTAAYGCALIDGGGNELFERALAFQALGYRVATMRDSDVHPTPDLEKRFADAGGRTFRWRDNRALQDAGVRLGLGFDNCSCSDAQNMFVAMKLFALLGGPATRCPDRCRRSPRFGPRPKAAPTAPVSATWWGASRPATRPT